MQDLFLWLAGKMLLLTRLLMQVCHIQEIVDV
jgi:hypothetical protein